MGFWDRVREEIHRNNTTQEWVAGKLGMRPDSFSRAMRKKSLPKVDIAVSLANLLGTTVEHLVTGKGAEVIYLPEVGSAKRTWVEEILNKTEAEAEEMTEFWRSLKKLPL